MTNLEQKLQRDAKFGWGIKFIPLLILALFIAAEIAHHLTLTIHWK